MITSNTLAQEAIEIQKLKAELAEKRKKKRYSGSKLRKYFPEAKQLREEHGFSFADIALWLRTKKRVKLSTDGVRSAYQRIEKELDSDIHP